MQIWINSPFDPLPLEGGRPLRYELLAEALVGLGHDVVWWSSDFHHLRKAKRVLEPVYECGGGEVRLVPTMPYHSNVSLRRMISHHRYAASWRKMAVEAVQRREVSPPDLIVLSMPPLGLFDQAVKFRNELGCRIAVDIQDAWPENFYALIPLVPRAFLEKLLWRFKQAAGRAYTCADCISAVAEKYVRIAESYGALSPAKVFPLGGLLPKLEEGSAGSGNQLKLVYVGNLGASYDLKTMLDGVKALAGEGIDVVLEIAGDGPCRKNVEKAAERSTYVRYHGYLASDEMSRLLNDGDVGIIPMQDEMLVAVPNKLVDYAGHGLAVINGLGSETRDLLESFECGVRYEPGSVDSFKRAVMHYYNDAELLAKHKKNARRMAEANFDAARISAGMAEWMVIATTQPPSPRLRRPWWSQ